MILALGVFTTIVGWVFMLGFVGTGEFAGRAIANLHLMQIAESIVNGGYALIIAGIIKSGVEKICIYLSGVPAMKAANDLFEEQKATNAARPDEEKNFPNPM